MSHDTTINSVPIWDTRALYSAVDDLQLAGVNCMLKENAHARMYGTRKLAAEYVLSLPDCRYDVAFVRETPESPLLPVCDLIGQRIASQIGVADYVVSETREDGTEKTATEIKEERQMAAIGRLVQAYSNHATINALEAEGHTIIEQTIDQNGELQLTYI